MGAQGELDLKESEALMGNQDSQDPQDLLAPVDLRDHVENQGLGEKGVKGVLVDPKDRLDPEESQEALETVESLGLVEDLVCIVALNMGHLILQIRMYLQQLVKTF